MAVLNSTLRLSLLDQVTSPMRRISGVMANFQRQQTAFALPLRSLTGQVLAFGGAYLGVTRGISGTAGAAMDFETAFADVRKVVDATDEQFENMRRTIRQMSTELPLASTEIAALFAAAGESGVATADLKQFSEMAARVGIAFDMTAGQAGESLAKLKTQLGLSVAQTGDLADAINHLSNNMASKASDVTEYMLRVGALAEMGGFSAEQIAGIGSAMIAAGAQAETAGTAMQNVVKALTRGSSAKKAQREAAQALGLDLPAIAKDMQKDAPKALKTVLTAIGKAPKDRHIALLSEFFGDEAKAFAPLIGNIGLLENALDSVSNKTRYSGSAFKEYVARANTTANVLQLLSNKFADLGVGIGDRMLPRIREAALGIGDVIDSLGERAHIFSKFDAASQGFMKGLGIDGGIREAMNELGDLFFGAADGSKAADQIGRIFVKFRKWGEDIKRFSAAVAENPLAKLFADMAPYGLQIMLWGTGIAFLAGTIRKLAGALMFLSGASTILAALKTAKGLADIVGGGVPGLPGGGKPPVGGTPVANLATSTALGTIFRRVLPLAAIGGAAYGGLKTITDPSQELQDAPRSAWGVDDALRSLWKSFNTTGGNPYGAEADKTRAQQQSLNAFSGVGQRLGIDAPVRIDSSSIQEMVRPSGTQDVKITNPQPPVVNLTVNQSISGVLDPQAAGNASAGQIGSQVKSAVESAFIDAQ